MVQTIVFLSDELENKIKDFKKDFKIKNPEKREPSKNDIITIALEQFSFN